MKTWHIVGASVQGTSHQQNDIPCQDAHGYRVMLNGAVVIAVADGAGTANRSHEGAQRAVEQALDTLERDLAYNVPRTEFAWQRLMTDAFRQAREAIVRHAGWEDVSLQDFAATLTCAVASDEGLVVGQIGDCLAIARKGKDAPLFVATQLQRGEYANETFFLTLDDALDHLQVQVSPPVQVLAILQGRVSPTGQGRQPGQRVTTIKCPQCGGELHYEPGATEVACPYCGHQVPLQRANVIEGEARLVGDIRLQRRYRGQAWVGIERIAHCQSCGAELTLIMSHRLSQQRIFCSSTNVLVEDHEWALEQPDGFLPFAVGEEQAAEAIREAQHVGLRRVKTWLVGKGKGKGQEQKVLNLQGVYVPFWVFDGFVDVRAWSEGISAIGTWTQPR